MTTPTFLAHLVDTRGLQPEPVATSLLTHLLRNSPAARAVVQELAASIHPSGDFDGLDFTEQASLEGGEGRPDIIGTNITQVSLIIEAKFDAGLTAAQSKTGYLGGLGTNGLLLFLVPGDRVAPLWPKLLGGPIGMSNSDLPPAPDATTLLPPLLTHPLANGKCVAVTSWQHLLSRLGPALSGTGMESDMVQLTGLVESQVAAEWVPAANDDLTPRTGRQLHRLRDAVRVAATTVSLGKVKNGTNDSGPARWVTSADGSTLFWAGVRIPTWGRLGVSPLWVVVIKKDPILRKATKDALNPLTAIGGPGVYELDPVTLGVPLSVPLGAELPEVTASLVMQLQAIRELLLAQGAASDDQSEAEDPLSMPDA